MSDEQPQRPASDGDHEEWKAYWAAQGMAWRTEPEIEEQRRAYLAERRAVKPAIERGIYPFRDENGSIRLTRADVEWLLATHESGGMRGPVDWDVEKDKEASRRRLGVDLRGADLCGIDLSGLPLASIRGGLRANHRRGTSEQHRDNAGVRFEGAILRGAHLEDARLFGAHLERAVLSDAHLQGAVLSHATLQEASLGFTHLEGTDLDAAHLEGSGLGFARLEGATLCGAHLEGTNLNNAHLEGAGLTRAHLTGAKLYYAHLETAYLNEAQLGGAELGGAHLEGAYLYDTHLEGADLTRAYFDGKTYLTGVTLGGTWTRAHWLPPAASPAVSLCDVHWGGADLTVVRWRHLLRLGDEQKARNKAVDGYRKPRDIRVLEFEDAVRANRQLASALRAQGLNDDADRFAYRAHICQRGVHLLQFQLLQWLFSWLLFIVAGYSYRPLRTLYWYLAGIGVFAFAYFQVTHGALAIGLSPTELHPLAWYEALVLSVSACHGRGFFSLSQNLGDPVAILAAAEAVFGLFIEVSFIATFTQRFFGK